VLEHESQYVCSACLAGLPRPADAGRGGSAAGLAFLFVAALLGAWFFFYLLGQGLLRIKG
jgi:hypothetical protein